MELFDSPWGWPFIISTVLALGGIGFAIWTWRRSRRAKLLTRIEVSPIGLPGDSAVRVTYGQTVVPIPSLVKVRVQHIGGQEIAKYDDGHIQFVPQASTNLTASLNGRKPEGQEGFEYAKNRVVALLGDAAKHASLDSGSGVVTVTPRMFKNKESVELSLLCMGNPKFQADVRVANVDHVRTFATPTLGDRAWSTGLSLFLAAWGVAMVWFGLWIGGGFETWVDWQLLTVIVVGVSIVGGALLVPVALGVFVYVGRDLLKMLLALKKEKNRKKLDRVMGKA